MKSKTIVTVPWNTCRTCHNIGTTGYCEHVNMTIEKRKCGQCKKTRHLIECHAYDFRGKRK